MKLMLPAPVVGLASIAAVTNPASSSVARNLNYRRLYGCIVPRRRPRMLGPVQHTFVCILRVGCPDALASFCCIQSCGMARSIGHREVAGGPHDDG